MRFRVLSFFLANCANQYGELFFSRDRIRSLRIRRQKLKLPSLQIRVVAAPANSLQVPRVVSALPPAVEGRCQVPDQVHHASTSTAADIRPLDEHDGRDASPLHATVPELVEARVQHARRRDQVHSEDDAHAHTEEAVNP